MRIPGAVVLISFPLMVAFPLSRASGQEDTRPASKQKQRADSAYSEIQKAPEKARAKRNPLEKDPDAVAAGRVLFEQRCAECHGDNGAGSQKAPGLRAREIQDAEPGAIFWILTNGVIRKGMPVWSKLPEPQRWQLVSYIKSLRAPAKTETPSTDESPPPAAKDSPSQPR